MNLETRVRRHPDRGKYDEETLHGILDEAYICHVAFSADGSQLNVPMLHVRDGNRLYLHGSIKSRIFQSLSRGIPVCITATLIDGLVLAKSAYNSSMNYRSAMIMGSMRPVNGKESKLHIATILAEKLARGRSGDCRMPSDSELEVTGFLWIQLEGFSCKVRSGPPVDSPNDSDLPHWSGVIPLSMEHGQPQTSPGDAGRIGVPEYLLH